MKLLQLLPLFLSISSVNAQLISEAVYKFHDENVSFLYSSSLDITFNKEYRLGEIDTFNNIVFEINHYKSTINNCSFCAKGNCTKNNCNNTIITRSLNTLNHKEFTEMYSCLNDMFKYINDNETPPSKSECTSNDLILSSEKNKFIRYYISNGETIHKIRKNDFLKMVKFLKNVKNNWQ